MKIRWILPLFIIICATPPTLYAYAAYQKANAAFEQSKVTHTLFNSRMTEMIALIRTESAATAVLKEKAEQLILHAGKK